MRITGDNDEGKAQLDNFIHPERRYPVIATTSKLLTTGVDAQTCKVIVLDQRIQSMIEFKQIIGRGTRIRTSTASSASRSWTSGRPPSCSPTRTGTARRSRSTRARGRRRRHAARGAAGRDADDEIEEVLDDPDGIVDAAEDERGPTTLRRERRRGSR